MLLLKWPHEIASLESLRPRKLAFDLTLAIVKAAKTILNFPVVVICLHCRASKRDYKI